MTLECADDWNDHIAQPSVFPQRSNGTDKQRSLDFNSVWQTTSVTEAFCHRPRATTTSPLIYQGVRQQPRGHVHAVTIAAGCRPNWPHRSM